METDADDASDPWLQKSIERSNKHDPDYKPTESDVEDYDAINLVLNVPNPVSDRSLLVYESHLKMLMKFCCKCGAPVDRSLITENQREGTQITYKFTCLQGCDVHWSTQSKLAGVKGLGNLFLVAATEMSGIPVQKILRFAQILNLKCIDESNYYRLRAKYVYPEINSAWKRNQIQQIEDIKNSENVLDLALDGQCDTPGHNSTFCTVTAMNVETNKVLDFKVVHVKEVKHSQNMEKEGFIRYIVTMFAAFAFSIPAVITTTALLAH